jgi:hypothetical protein
MNRVFGEDRVFQGFRIRNAYQLQKRCRRTAEETSMGICRRVIDDDDNSNEQYNSNPTV